MPHNFLQSSGGNTFLVASHREGVAQYVGCHGSADMRSVSNVFDQALDSTDAYPYIVV